MYFGSNLTFHPDASSIEVQLCCRSENEGLPSCKQLGGRVCFICFGTRPTRLIQLIESLYKGKRAGPKALTDVCRNYLEDDVVAIRFFFYSMFMRK